MISFNRAIQSKKGLEYVSDAISSGLISGDHKYTKKCHQWFENNFKVTGALLTTSCTHALEMAAILCGIKEGDEVIMPSYTFVSTANAFVMRGAKIVFVDIRPDTMNIDENLIEGAITKKTKAIVPVHYAGVACEMDKISEIAKKNNLFIVEDAAQAVMSKYKNRYLGSIGDFGCYSFHETKNYTMGEGGALIVKDKSFLEDAEIIREKGTNRSKFFRGEIDKYSWVSQGSSYLPSDMNAAYLYAQLEEAENLLRERISIWNSYYQNLLSLKEEGKIELPHVPSHCQHNAHMFFIKVKNLETRQKLLSFLKENKIHSVFHYVPLHSSKAGQKFSRFHGDDVYTTKESERLLRLPLFHDMSDWDIKYVCSKIREFLS